MSKQLAKKLKHNKLRNTGLIFEILVRQITTDILNKKTDSKAKTILEKHFTKNAEITKEQEYYNILLESKNKTKRTLFKLLSEIQRDARNINYKKLNREKYKLIKDINESFGDVFFKTNVPEYKILASIYKLLVLEEDKTVKPKLGEKAIIEESLVEQLSSTKPIAQELNKLPKKLSDDEYITNKLTFKILVETFNNKYKHLNEVQKHILKLYVENPSSSPSLKTALLDQIKAIKRSLLFNKTQVNDEALKIKIDMSIDKMDELSKKINEGKINDKIITTALLYSELDSSIQAL